VLKTADGALEAAPAMGAADIILDLVSTGVTLRENNLKEVQGGNIMKVCSTGCAARKYH
jgi:ATP phosphoribosyltransferase